MTLGALWILIFVLMVATQVATGPAPSLEQIAIGNLGSAHRFGDMTVAELFRGEIWRAVTCTFVHYNLLHIGVNLCGLYQLGCLAEMWYGPWQFVGLYVVIGGGGNLLAGLGRARFGTGTPGARPMVILGLGRAVVAAVGWRSKTRIREYLRGEMWILLFTAFLGKLPTSFLDNWHAGGVVGASMGFAHRAMVRSSGSGSRGPGG